MLNLESARGEVEDRIKRLYGRLNPVMAPAKPEVNEAVPEKASSRETSDTVAWIYSEIQYNHVYAAMLEDILTRLEV